MIFAINLLKIVCTEYDLQFNDEPTKLLCIFCIVYS